MGYGDIDQSVYPIKINSVYFNKPTFLTLSKEIFALRERADVLLQLSRFEEAVKYYMQHLAAHPADIYSIKQIAFCFIRCHKYQEGEEYLNLGISLAPEESWFYHTKSRLYRYKGNIEKAEELIQTALTLNPSEATYYISYAGIYYLRSDYEKLMDMASKALELDPRTEFGYAFLSDGYNGLERSNKAIEALFDGLKVFPGSSVLHHRLGCVYLEKNNIDQAFHHFSIAVGTDPNNPDHINKYEWVKSVKDMISSENYDEITVQKRYKKRDGKIVSSYYTVNSQGKGAMLLPFLIMLLLVKIGLALLIGITALKFGLKSVYEDITLEERIDKDLPLLTGIVTSVKTEFITRRDDILPETFEKTTFQLDNKDELFYWEGKGYFSRHGHRLDTLAPHPLMGKKCTIRFKQNSIYKSHQIYFFNTSGVTHLEPKDIDKQYLHHGWLSYFIIAIGLLFTGIAVSFGYSLYKELRR